MSPEREWGKLYHCFTCNKGLANEEYFNSHTALGHKTDIYKTMPRNIDMRTASKEEVISPSIKDEIRRDYADIEEVESEDWEINQQ